MVVVSELSDPRSHREAEDAFHDIRFRLLDTPTPKCAPQ